MYFLVSSHIVDRDDLTIEEKMACVVLARYAGQTQFNGLLSNDIIALKMGVSVKVAELAIKQLIHKGVLAQSGEKETTVIKQGNDLPMYDFEVIAQENQTQKGQAENLQKTSNHHPAQKDLQPPDIETIQAVFDEFVSPRQALILFQMAGSNLRVLSEVYHSLSHEDHLDVIESLMMRLQERNNTEVHMGGVTKNEPDVLDDKEAEALFEALSPSKPSSEKNTQNPVKTQINMKRINALYQQQKLKK